MVEKGQLLDLVTANDARVCRWLSVVLRLGKQGSENPRLSRRRLAGVTAEPLWGAGGAPSTDDLVNKMQNMATLE